MCGLTIDSRVASFAEAWIEKREEIRQAFYEYVASFAEAWIENDGTFFCFGCGLVASFAEAWIEKKWKHEQEKEVTCRLLRGGVD